MAEQKYTLRPDDLIDRKAEQELFRNLVSFTTPARMLTICAEGGQGKSSLLKRLEYNCQHVKPPVPVYLIALEQLTDASPFALLQKISFELKGVDFPKFVKLNNARAADNFSPFELRTSSSHITINTVGDEAMVVDQYTSIEHADVVHSTRLPFTPVQQEFAQRKCIEAFFEDLRVVCATKPIVLIFDTWERCDLNLRDWITTELFREHCFTPDPNLRPAKLAIVLASRPYSKEERFGLRDDELVNVFADQQEYEAMVLSLKSLSNWESEHVRNFLELNGITDVDDDDINYIRDSLKKGRSLQKILDGFTAMVL